MAEVSKQWKTRELYVKYQIKLRKSIAENTKVKENFESTLADNIKQENKSFFAYAMKKETSNKVGPIRDADKNLIERNKKTAHCLSNCFSRVFIEKDTFTCKGNFW